jgi:hypothetical protein
MVWGWCLWAWPGRHQATGHGRGQSRSWPWWHGCSSIIVSQMGFFDLVRFYNIGYCRIESHGTKYSLNGYHYNYEVTNMSVMAHSFVLSLLGDKEHPMHNWHTRSWIDTMKSLSPAVRTLKPLTA